MPLLRIFLVRLASLLCVVTSLSNADRSFRVDYDKNVFLKDGQPYRYISGEIHYFRIHPSLWQDRLQRVRAAGLNAVQVYIPWNFHEIMAGVVDFESPEKNLTQFLDLAQQNSLDVLLRIGPYICAEWENGGLPWWLLRHENITMRTSDDMYKEEVKKYFDVLLPMVKPLLYNNGGPVIMVQIENEYGSYYACDRNYMRWLRDLVHGALGQDTQLYTTDGPGDSYLMCGSVEGVFATVDFGVDTSSNIQTHFNHQRKFSKGGPYTNSEFYTVWFTGWGGSLQGNGWGTPGFTLNSNYSLNNVIQNTVKSMEDMYKLGASFNFYMIHGGTNYGFWSGDEVDGPVITSYDYSAPISEAGQITPLYLAIRDFIGNLTGWPNTPLEVPKNHTAVAIDNVKTVRVGSLVSVVENSIDHDHCKSSEEPLSFEMFDNQYDFVLYSAVLPKVDGNWLELEIPDLHDYAYVFVDGAYQGHLAIDQDYTRQFSRLSLPLKNGSTGSNLTILVENHGRRTYETINDYKGILSNVTVNKQVVSKWLQCGVNPNKLYSQSKKMWSSMTLFVPGAILRKKNVVVVVELVGQTSSEAQTPEIDFLEKPIYKKPGHQKHHHFHQHHNKQY